MKRNVVVLLATLFCASCAAQKPNGLYCDGNLYSVVCIKEDSISIGFKRSEWDGLLYYYGTFSRTNDTIILKSNVLKHKNAIVIAELTDYSGIEIQLFELHLNMPLGAPTNHISTYYELTKDFRVWWNYQLDKKGLLFWNSKPNAKAVNGLIQIPMDIASKECAVDNEFLIGGYGFFTEQILEIKPHVRYIIKQKTYKQNHRPMVPQEVPVVYNAKTNQIEITENSSINYEPYKTFKLKHVGEGESCLGELRKRYPDL